jgi:hypothetical protein
MCFKRARHTILTITMMIMKNLALWFIFGFSKLNAGQEVLGNPVCFVCGGETDMITNPDGIFTIPEEFNSPVDRVSCNSLLQAGRNGLIPVEECLAAQESEELQTFCGCTTAEATTEPDSFPVCFICGSATAIVTNGDAIFTVPEGIDAQLDKASCDAFSTAGLAGLVAPELCSAAQMSTELKDTCGCQEPIIEASDVPVVETIPTPSPKKSSTAPTAMFPTMTPAEAKGSKSPTSSDQPSNVPKGEKVPTTTTTAPAAVAIPIEAPPSNATSSDMPSAVPILGGSPIALPAAVTSPTNAIPIELLSDLPSDVPSDSGSDIPIDMQSDVPSELSTSAPTTVVILSSAPQMACAAWVAMLLLTLIH